LRLCSSLALICFFVPPLRSFASLILPCAHLLLCSSLALICFFVPPLRSFASLILPCAHLPLLSPATVCRRPSSHVVTPWHPASSRLKMKCCRSATACCTKARSPKTWSSLICTTAWGKLTACLHEPTRGVRALHDASSLPRLFRKFNGNARTLTAQIRNCDAQLKQVRGLGFYC
jgi:hypothetical protein